VSVSKFKVADDMNSIPVNWYRFSAQKRF